jgi:hypothetical protein
MNNRVDSNPRGDSNTQSTEISLLKRLPAGHYTEHEGKSITVGELLDRLTKQESK